VPNPYLEGLFYSQLSVFKKVPFFVSSTQQVASLIFSQKTKLYCCFSWQLLWNQYKLRTVEAYLSSRHNHSSWYHSVWPKGACILG